MHLSFFVLHFGVPEYGLKMASIYEA